MRSESRHRANFVRHLLICLVLVPAFLLVSGCCTCKVEPYHAKTLVIVKQAHENEAGKYLPQGALVGFSHIKAGETLSVINKFGRTVEVDFPANVIEGEHAFDLKKCESRTVTLKSDSTVGIPVEVILTAKNNGDHGGADMIVDPGPP